MGDKTLTQYHQALQWEPNLPIVYYAMSWDFYLNFNLLDSAEYHALHAVKLAPSWVLPICFLSGVFSGSLFSGRLKQFDRARHYLEIANSIDSNSVYVLNALGSYYYNRKEFAPAEQQFIKAIQHNSSYVQSYIALADLYFRTGRYAESEQHCKKAIQLDFTIRRPFKILGSVYAVTNRFNDAELQFKKNLQSDDSTSAGVFEDLVLLYFSTQRYPEAEELYKKAFQLDSTNANIYYNYACGQSLQKHSSKAFEYSSSASG